MSLSLQTKHVHERDAFVSFEEATHVYTVHGELGYTSVTTWNHQHFRPFDQDAIIDKIMRNPKMIHDPTYKYFGKTAEDIKSDWEQNRNAASAAGTSLHLDIEHFFNDVVVDNTSTEYGYFVAFWNDFRAEFPHVRPYRTEWVVYYEEMKIAGSIDMVFENTQDGTLWIYDWKRSKQIEYEPNSYRPEFSTTDCISHLPDTNFWHYTLQLNMYKFILESKYNATISKMCLVCLHPDNVYKSYELFEVAPLCKEIQDLYEYRIQQVANSGSK